jgi:hypothetical protein
MIAIREGLWSGPGHFGQNFRAVGTFDASRSDQAIRVLVGRDFLLRSTSELSSGLRRACPVLATPDLTDNGSAIPNSRAKSRDLGHPNIAFRRCRGSCSSTMIRGNRFEAYRLLHSRFIPTLYRAVDALQLYLLTAVTPFALVLVRG